MDTSFLMDRDPVGACVGESRNELVGIFDHQMAVEGNVNRFSQRSNHWRPNRDVGHEMPIHDVDVQKGSATAQCCVRILRQTGEIS